MNKINMSILDAQNGMVVHQVNCRGKMGAGLALAIRNKWPKVYSDYMDRFIHRGIALGEVIFTKVTPELVVASLAGQYDYGREKRCYTQYDAVVTGLKAIRETNIHPVYIPYGMGCTLAGGNWETMMAHLAYYLPDCIIANYKQG